MKNKIFASLVILLLCKSLTLAAGNTWGKNREEEAQFFCAAYEGDIDTLKAMVQNGISANTTSKYGESVLGYAVAGLHIETARFLLEQRASVTDMVAPDQTPITVALERYTEDQAPEMLHMLLRYYPSRHALKDSTEVKLLAAQMPGDPIITILDDAIEEVEKPGSSTIAASVLTDGKIFPAPIIGIVQSFISEHQETPEERRKTLRLLETLHKKNSKPRHNRRHIRINF
jgi:hypothetical protein